MKKIFTLFVLALCLCQNPLDAQTTYLNYGADGWRIGLNENVGFDINEDGEIDMYLNAAYNKIGIYPVFITSCFAADENYFYNNLGSRALRQFYTGDVIQLTGGNMSTYTEGDSLSFYAPSMGIANEWTPNQETILGFALVPDGLSMPLDGWMNVSVDVENEELVIWEVVYMDDFNPQGIEVNALTTNTENLAQDFSHFSVQPNPARGFFNLNYAYRGAESLSVQIMSATGHLVYSAPSAPRRDNIEINTENLAAGMYYVHFTTPSARFTQKVSVVK